MKGRFEDYQKYIDTINGKIEGVRKDIEDIRETFNEKARVRAGQIAMQRGGPSTQYWNAPPPKKNAGSLA